MDIRYSQIKTGSVVDGPGVRTVLFLQGCTIGCPGCQNAHLWPADGGHLEFTEELAKTIAALSPHGNVTISGGEPFQQLAGLTCLLYALRKHGLKHIIVYSGYTWEKLTMNHDNLFWVMEALHQIDVLVDGPFIRAQDHNLINWRGSANQRPIDVPLTLASGDLVLLDWDAPVLTIGEDGSVVMPIGMADVMDDLGTVEKTRMCGQTK